MEGEWRMEKGGSRGKKLHGEALRTRRSKIHYADRKVIGGTPLFAVSQKQKTDYMTAEEILSDLYDKEVVKVEVTFKDGHEI